MAINLTFKLASGTAGAKERRDNAVKRFGDAGVKAEIGYSPVNGHTLTIQAHTPRSAQRELGLSKDEAFALCKAERKLRDEVLCGAWILVE